MFRWKLLSSVVLVAGVQVLNAEEFRSAANSQLGNSGANVDVQYAPPPQVYVAPDAYTGAPQPVEPCPVMSHGPGSGQYGSPDYAPGSFPSLRGFWFRRYAGSVEMPTKTWYPRTYSGSYYYNGWRPAWIRDVPVPRPALAVDRFWHEPGAEFLYHPHDDHADAQDGPRPQTGEPSPTSPAPKISEPFDGRPSRYSNLKLVPTDRLQTTP